MTPADRELLRHAAREFLHARAGTAHTAPAIRRRLATELPFEVTDDAITAELQFLQDKGQVTFEHDDLGSTRWWRITAEGQLAAERA